MHRIFIMLIGAGLMLAAPSAMAAPKAVVELFTSQGCSSCVAADEYLDELSRRDDVLALSFHVDYWDYLGWQDTFGSPENTERQRDYADALGNRRIYTPQMIINGTTGVVGSDREAVEKELAASSLPLNVRMYWHDETLVIKVPARPLPGSWPTTIRLFLFSSKAEVQIGHGENAGATIDYYNIVRTMRPVGMWDGTEVKITLPGKELIGNGVDGCAVIVQEELASGPGRILGAALIEEW